MQSATDEEDDKTPSEELSDDIDREEKDVNEYSPGKNIDMAPFLNKMEEFIEP